MVFLEVILNLIWHAASLKWSLCTGLTHSCPGIQGVIVWGKDVLVHPDGGFLLNYLPIWTVG